MISLLLSLLFALGGLVALFAIAATLARYGRPTRLLLTAFTQNGLSAKYAGSRARVGTTRASGRRPATGVGPGRHAAALARTAAAA